ncbi:MAG TPA: hypothetical protein VEI83_01980 [Acidimicrobiales bacterium]|nr:hypothetical protein [Acidimicrobiales bacterium]
MARSRLRSVRYDLEAAIALARMVDNAGGPLDGELLAATLGYSGTNNGTYLTRLANARLFGLVGGSGPRVELTDRARRILAGVEPGASRARREAFLAVPLFKAVWDTQSPGAFDRASVAHCLSEEFGEEPQKASAMAGRLLASARQAGLLAPGQDGDQPMKVLVGAFTTVENSPSRRWWSRVVPFAVANPGGRPASAPGPGRAAMAADDGDLWLDEETPQRPARPWLRDHVALAAAIVVGLGVVTVPVALAATGGGGPHPSAQKPPSKPGTLGNGPAEHQVLSALSATTDSGSFDFTYSMTTTPPTSAPSITTTTVCKTFTAPGPTNLPAGAVLHSSGTAVLHSSGTNGGGFVSSSSGSVIVVPAQPSAPPGTEQITQCSGGAPTNTGSPTTGKGVIDTNPMAMLAGATVGGAGGLTATVRVDSTTVYEDLGPLETSLAPPASQANATGQPISGFASLVEGTLGQREGAVAMMGMANPTGYLELYQADITGADQTGTSSVDGVPVTVYEASTDPSKLVNAPGISSEESTTISAALGVLNGQGYSGTTVGVSVDGSGFIREAKAVTHFSDGGTVVLDVTLSNFGCAGTVLMPGQQGADSPPANCTSPDTGSPIANAATTTTTTTAPSPTSSTSVPPTTIGPSVTTEPSTTSTTTSTTVPTTTSSTG